MKRHSGNAGTGGGSGGLRVVPRYVPVETTGVVSTLKSSIKGAKTFSKLSGASQLSVNASTGALSTSLALDDGASLTAIFRVAANSGGEAYERSITITGKGVETTPAPVFTVQPSISPSSGEVGDTFTASDGAVSNGSITGRQWTLGGADIDDETASTFLSTAPGALRVRVTATGPGGTVSATSNPVTISVPGEDDLDETLPIVTLSLATGRTTWPPQLGYAVDGGTENEDELEVRVASSYLNLLAGNYIPANAAIDPQVIGSSPLDFGLSGITSPAKTFGYARLWRDGKHGNWGPVILHGDAAAPVLTSSATPSAQEQQPVLATLVYDEPHTMTISGADADGLYVVNGSVPALSHEIRRAGDVDVDYDSATGGKPEYKFLASAVDLAGNVASDEITVGVIDKDEVPDLDATSLPPVSNATRSTGYALSYTVAGLGPGVAVPVVVGVPWRKNGANAANGTTVVNGDVITSQSNVQSSSAYSTAVNTSVRVGDTTYNWTITTLADPAALVFVPSALIDDVSIGAGTVATYSSVDFQAGLGVVFIGPILFSSSVASVSIGGVAATKRGTTDSGNGKLEVWTAPVASAGNKAVVVTYNDAQLGVYARAGTVVGGANATPASVQFLNWVYNNNPHAVGGALTVPTNGIGVSYVVGNRPIETVGDTLVTDHPDRNLFTRVATGTPTFDNDQNDYFGAISISWGL